MVSQAQQKRQGGESCARPARPPNPELHKYQQSCHRLLREVESGQRGRQPEGQKYMTAAIETLFDAGALQLQIVLCCSGHSGLPTLASAVQGLTWPERGVQSRDSRFQLLPLGRSLLSCSSLLWGPSLGPYRWLVVGARHTWAECFGAPAAALSCISCRQAGRLTTISVVLYRTPASCKRWSRVRQDGTGNSTLQA